MSASIVASGKFTTRVWPTSGSFGFFSRTKMQPAFVSAASGRLDASLEVPASGARLSLAGCVPALS